jgi:hypothetical protein
LPATTRASLDRTRLASNATASRANNILLDGKLRGLAKIKIFQRHLHVSRNELASNPKLVNHALRLALSLAASTTTTKKHVKNIAWSTTAATPSLLKMCQIW